MKAISDIINNPEDPRWRAPEAPQIGIEKICLEDPWGPDPNWFEKEMKDSVGTRPICYVTGPDPIYKKMGHQCWSQILGPIKPYTRYNYLKLTNLVPDPKNVILPVKMLGPIGDQ